MNIREEELAGRIVRGLDKGLEHIDHATLARLRSGRENALERFEQAPAWAWTLASAGTGRGSLKSFHPRHLVSVLALLVAISGMVYWQQLQHGDDPVDIDAKLLSGDLPIDAYLDKGLDTWLTR